MWLYLIIGLLAIGLIAVSYYFSNMIIRIRTFGNDEILSFEVDGGRLTKEQYEQLPKEELRIPSPYGYWLNAWFIPSTKGITKRTVVFAHGVTSSLLGMLKYTDMFRRWGFNVLVYDHRRHGLSGGADTTFGFYEKYDLKAAVDWVFNRFGSSSTVGVFGESMGAATALQHAKIDDRASFYVVDCPYSDLNEQLAYRLKVQYGLPRFPLIPLTSLWCKLRAGFRFRDVSPIVDVAEVRAPVLFIHGEQDRFVPTEMSIALHKAKQGPKALYVAPNAAHAESWAKNRAEYEGKLEDFLRSLGLLPDPARA
jgi:fermentation-respiration switch protein FrsA (DUF1100 family)